MLLFECPAPYSRRLMWLGKDGLEFLEVYFISLASSPAVNPLPKKLRRGKQIE